MRAEIVQRGKAQPEADAVLIVPAYEAQTPSSSLLSDETNAALQHLSEANVIKGEAAEAYYLPTPGGVFAGVAAIGLGAQDELEPEVLRRCAGNLAAPLQQNKIRRVTLDASGVEGLPAPAFLEGLVIGQYAFERYRNNGEPAVNVESAAVIVSDDAKGDAIQKACNRTLLIADCVNWARDLGNTASNELTPTRLSDIAVELATELKCTCHVMNEDEIMKEGLHLLLAVGRGSEERATLSILRYRPENPKEIIALVGKGITFDSGGVSIKPSDKMHEMKFDMCGAAGVMGAFRALAQLKPNVEVLAVIPAAENMPSGAAVSPGEIVEAYNGKTVEIRNTDAEGRLILADAMACVIERFAPNKVIDMATLTGAAVIAMGHFAAPVIGNDDNMAAALVAAGQATGDRCWQLPLFDDYHQLMKGTTADLTNASPSREAGSITAACFLSKFVGQTPWAHLDIAGTAWGQQFIPYYNKDLATGYGVRLLTQYVLDVAGY